MSDFERALEFLWRAEGGRADDPDDRGKRTNFGVTQGLYNDWLEERKLPKDDVWKITRERARQVYLDKFWWVGRPHAWPLSVVLFDSAVHHGPGTATAWLGKVSWMDADPKAQAWAVLCYRRDLMRALVAKDATQKKFIRGWLNRTEALARFAGLVPGSTGGAAAPNS